MKNAVGGDMDWPATMAALEDLALSVRRRRDVSSDEE